MLKNSYYIFQQNNFRFIFPELNVLQGLCTILYGINLSQIHEIVLTLGHVSELISDKRDF